MGTRSGGSAITDGPLPSPDAFAVASQRGRHGHRDRGSPELQDEDSALVASMCCPMPGDGGEPVLNGSLKLGTSTVAWRGVWLDVTLTLNCRP